MMNPDSLSLILIYSNEPLLKRSTACQFFYIVYLATFLCHLIYDLNLELFRGK